MMLKHSPFIGFAYPHSKLDKIFNKWFGAKWGLDWVFWALGDLVYLWISTLSSIIAFTGRLILGLGIFVHFFHLSLVYLAFGTYIRIGDLGIIQGYPTSNKTWKNNWRVKIKGCINRRVLNTLQELISQLLIL